MRANTADVATDAPDTAAKPAVANIVATAMPPGNQPTQRFAASNRALVRPGVIGQIADQDKGRDQGQAPDWRNLGMRYLTGNLDRYDQGFGKLIRGIAEFGPENPDQPNQGRQLPAAKATRMPKHHQGSTYLPEATRPISIGSISWISFI